MKAKKKKKKKIAETECYQVGHPEQAAGYLIKIDISFSNPYLLKESLKTEGTFSSKVPKDSP